MFFKRSEKEKKNLFKMNVKRLSYAEQHYFARKNGFSLFSISLLLQSMYIPVSLSLSFSFLFLFFFFVLSLLSFSSYLLKNGLSFVLFPLSLSLSLTLSLSLSLYLSLCSYERKTERLNGFLSKHPRVASSTAELALEEKMEKRRKRERERGGRDR